ncbi:DNA-binding domain-containing protein [Ferrimonas gelatinilytica]|uniref:DUF2063 domain-containing protein n=1 Tax=Ferrimonas gelatinilytica TaxID=1255257 RepID=A0ABP9S0R8_9GAMM
MSVDFRDIQRDFMARIRTESTPEPPLGIEARRLGVYRELMFNNVSGFVDSGFPVLRRLTDPAQWHRLKRRFFAFHDCASPLFVDIAREFVRFLALGQHLEGLEPLPPWALDLAEYEYLELAVDTLDEVQDQPPLATPEAVLTGPLALYRATRLGQYDYPVQRLGAECPRVDPDPTHLLVYRKLDDRVGFVELNGISARLLTMLSEAPGQDAQALITPLSEALPDLPTEQVAQGGGQLLLQMAALGIVRGYRKG